MRTGMDEWISKMVPELTRLWWTDPAAALRRSMELQHLAFETALETVEQAADLLRLAARHAQETAERLWPRGNPAAGAESPLGGGRA